MAKCVIHIGMHKTGSTSIQHSLAALDDENHYYAQITGAPNHSVPVFSAFSASPLRHPINRARGYDEAGITEYAKRVRNDIHKSLEAAGERTLVIAGEGIKKLKRGADVPIAVLVPRVQLKKRLNVERIVAGRIPRLSARIEKQLRLVD